MIDDLRDFLNALKERSKLSTVNGADKHRGQQDPRKVDC